MDCNHARELMNSYIDSVLPEADNAAFEEHISCCENCHEEYDMLKKVSADLARTSAPLPDGFAERVHCALVNEKLSAEKNKKFVFPYYRVASGLVAALVVAVVGKYGIYDTYKKVNNDTANIAVQIANENVAGTEVIPTVSEEEEPPQVQVKAVEPTYTEKNAKPVEVETEKVVEEAIAPAPAAEPVTLAEPQTEVASSGGSSFALDAPQLNATVELTEYSSDNQPLMRSIVIEEPMAVFNEETDADVVKDESVHDSISAAGEKGAGEVEKETEIITAPIPAVATLYSNNDGNMLMINNFLLTFLEGSAVRKTDQEITVTVNADDYDSVVSRISENDYIKSVEKGVPFDGIGIIIIR